MERQLHKGDGDQLPALFRVLPAHPSPASLSERGVRGHERRDRHRAERLHRGGTDSEAVLRIRGRQLLKEKGAHGLPDAVFRVLRRIHSRRHAANVRHMPHHTRRAFRGGDCGKQHVRDRRVAGGATQRGHWPLRTEQQLRDGHSAVGGDMAARRHGKLWRAVLDCARRGRAIGGGCQHREPAGERDNKKQEQDIARPILPHQGVAAGHKHRHVRVLLGRAEQLPGDIQQGGPWHNRGHGHLFRHSVYRPLPLSPAGAKVAEGGQADKQRRGRHVPLARGIYTFCRRATSRGLLSVGIDDRLGQRTPLPCLPQHVRGRGTARPARHGKLEHPHGMGPRIRIWLSARRCRGRALGLCGHILDGDR